MKFRLHVWDLPTRLFHGLLALCFAGLVFTGKSGGDWMRWHFLLGQTVLSLLLFRLLWGFMGGHWSRFATFWPNPVATWRYLKAPTHQPGHNPLGAWSVWAMLLLLLVQGLSGLISDDEIAATGPLSHLAPAAWVSRASAWHISWGINLLIGLVVLHLAAITYYQFRRRALLGAMLHGDQDHDATQATSVDTALTRLKAAVLLVVCVGVVWGWIAKYAL